MAQRLVRSICGKCAQPYEPTDAELHSLGLERSAIEEMAAKKGAGCSNCNKTRYRGRKGIFEIFVLNDEARKLAYDGVPASVMRNKARELGMRTLREDGARKVVAGVTSTEEVMRVTSKDTD